MFNKKKPSEPDTNPSARNFWENKKDNLRWKVAVMFVLINVIGLELSAPGYSLSTMASSQLLEHSAFLPEIIEKFNEFNKYFGFVDISLSVVAGKSTKILVVLIMALMCNYFIRNKDPFSNLELLRSLPLKGHKKRHFYLREIAFYSKYIPSNVLAMMCEHCLNTNGCSRSIPLLGDDKTRSWCRLFAKLETEDVISWHKTTYDCRKAYYLKYGLMYSALFLTTVFAIVLFLNKAILHIPVNQTYLFWYIIAITIVFVLVSITHGLREGQGGAWRNFREHSKSFFSSDKFDVFIKNNLCFKITSDKEIKSIMTMTNYLSHLIENKLIKHICTSNQRSEYNITNIRRILQHLKAYFYVTYDKKINFRCALFLLSEDHKYLYPFVRDDSDHSVYYCLNDESRIHEISSQFFQIDKTSVASEAWRTNKSLSKNNCINTVCPVSSSHLKSIFCFPLSFHDDVFHAIKNLCRDLPINFGVLCVDSDSDIVFSEKNNNLNEIVIKPFADRITYELSIGIFYKNKEQ